MHETLKQPLPALPSSSLLASESDDRNNNFSFIPTLSQLQILLGSKAKEPIYPYTPNPLLEDLWSESSMLLTNTIRRYTQHENLGSQSHKEAHSDST